MLAVTEHFGRRLHLRLDAFVGKKFVFQTVVIPALTRIGKNEFVFQRALEHRFAVLVQKLALFVVTRFKLLLLFLFFFFLFKEGRPFFRKGLGVVGDPVKGFLPLFKGAAVNIVVHRAFFHECAKIFVVHHKALIAFLRAFARRGLFDGLRLRLFFRGSRLRFGRDGRHETDVVLQKFFGDFLVAEVDGFFRRGDFFRFFRGGGGFFGIVRDRSGHRNRFVGCFRTFNGNLDGLFLNGSFRNGLFDRGFFNGSIFG